MRSSYPLAALLAVTLLSGCADKVQPDSICPKTGFINHTDRITYFASGGGTTPKDVVAKAAINGFSGECAFKDKKSNNVQISLTLPFGAQKGPAGSDLKEKTLPYFISVLSPDETILQRQEFTTKISFDNTGSGSSSEEHVITIPLKSRDDAFKYKIIVGFALTHDQYKYNEEQK